MQELTWMESHIRSMEKGVELINKFHWNISWEDKDKLWIVHSGEKVILRTTSKENVDALLYGMALAYCIFDQSEIEQFRERHNYF